MASYVTIAAMDAVVGGTEVSVPETHVALRDSSTGYTGEGSYHIQLVTGGALGPVYRVSYSGFPNGSDTPKIPNDTATHMTVHRVVLDYAGNLTFADKRKLNVGWMGVNATIAQTAFTDGSYLETGVVTERTCAAGLLGGNGGLLDGIGSAEGDLVVRGATEWQALPPGSTSGYVLTSNGTGAVPTWQASGGGGGGVTSLNALTGALVIDSPDSSIAVTTSGSDIQLEVQAGSGGAAPWYPFRVLQDAPSCNFDNTPDATIVSNFANTATSGNTLLAIVATDGSVDTITTPSGWTKMLGVIQGYSQLAVYIKTSSGVETGFSATIVSTGTPWACRLYEIIGTHSTDQTNTATSTSGVLPQYLFPSLSPTSGSMVFFGACFTPSSIPQPLQFSIPTSQWIDVGITGASEDTAASRCLCAGLYLGKGAGSAIVPPTVTVGGTLSPGVALATFSIL